MQLILPAGRARGYERLEIVRGLVVGATFLAGGVFLAYLTLGTPFIEGFLVPGRPTLTQVVAGALAWTVAFTGPAGFGLLGIARLAATLERLGDAGPADHSVVAGVADRLSDDYVAAPRVRLPDGSMVPELVVGPFGVAVLERLPPPEATRRIGRRWEARLRSGRWIPIADPLERAARDAERVRHWLSSDEQDFVVKVYVAVVGTADVPRTQACAVVSPDQLAGWLAGLPAQRTLTPERRALLVERIQRAVAR